VNAKRLALAALLLLFLLRHDFWWWESGERVVGLPIGLAWHVLICFAVALAMALFAKIDEAES